MSLIAQFNNLRQQIDRLFEDLTREQPQLALCSSNGTPWMPAIELQETETALVLKAQLPGIEPGELDIQVSENAVFLSGEHQEHHKTSAKGLFRSEFHYGQFKRVIPLPTSIHREQVTAAMVAGLLTLTMPKATPALPNLVKVSLSPEGLPSQSARQSVVETTANDAKSAL
ncbi:Hsp20/alpha crystallin family protein [Chamaesiphon sp. VAR_48_metabat_135_sub]|uniref:Hsp20/alpha crystallin family protein n=1 Tax=Chamaesiphon sp. VAR_48_metabat_135_sub TaxID=2964699 RepID=UPI00286CDE0A|nr:Hsp20/alpha crystallin family protein [Chamaesiphon sp. VAR_48_metabat_135_sub]